MEKKNLVARYAAVKKQVGGNREKPWFEHTFGATHAERNYITPMNKENNRILAQLHFALGLTERHEGKFDAQVEAAIEVLENAIKEEGVITRAAAAKAEECLMPLAEAAKEYEVIFASHAHIDMNWKWGWQETVAITLSTTNLICSRNTNIAAVGNSPLMHNAVASIRK